MQWNVVGLVSEGEAIIIGGLNPWNYKWDALGWKSVELPHPQYASQLHKMFIYEIGAEGRRVRFAAGELSAGAFAFYLPS